MGQEGARSVEAERSVEVVMAEQPKSANSAAAPAEGLYDNMSVKTATASPGSHMDSVRIPYGGYDYGTATHQLRTAQLVANCVGAVCLYSEADRMGLGNFLLPVIFLLAEVFIVAKRWYHSIDGRFDFKQMLSVSDPGLKMSYAMNLFGGFILALMVHWTTAEIPSALSSLGFHLTDYLAIVTAFGSLALDVFEGAKQKFA
ncbi:hypothetical protein L596_006910 [Steinernema carpocapsae]|uniref:DUF7087 domain-containing protein n=2 Tax=Steinernema carpocapsae TaxID=34508 RepID=A0A4U5P7D7_STECR|nr:hypothetical protein L596_006910 [Steinernema carpocapsae]